MFTRCSPRDSQMVGIVENYVWICYAWWNMVEWFIAGQSCSTTHHQMRLKKKINCLLQERCVLIITLKIQKCESEKISVPDTSLMFWLSLKFSLWHPCGSSQNAHKMLPPESWFASQSLGLYLAKHQCHITLLSIFCLLELNISKWAKEFSLYWPWLPCWGDFFWDGPFPLFTFFSSAFIFWYFPYPNNAISGFRWDITVVTCASSSPILWDWEIKSKCSKLLLPLHWDHPFQTINYLLWDIFMVHVS